MTIGNPRRASARAARVRGVRLPPHWLAYVPALVVVVLTVLFLVLRARAAATSAEVTHSHEVITEVDRLLLALVTAESRQRGFLLTGNTAYLEPAQEATGEVREHLRTLRDLTLDDPGQQQRLDLLDDWIGAKLDELASTRTLRDSLGAASKAATVGIAHGQSLMLGIRDQVAAFEAEEDRLLAGRLALDAAEQQRALLAIVLCSLFASAVSYLIGRQLGAAAEAQAAQTGMAELQNRRLEEQANELRRQTVRLEDVAVELEASNDELQRANEDLIRVSVEADVARQLAEEANQAKSRFLATMSHELRTPLNAIGGYAELVDMGVHGPVTEPQRHALARIQVAQRHLLGLINDLLNYAKIEAGRVEYRMSDVRVAAVAEEVISLLAPQVQDRRIHSLCAADADVRARADAERLRQILVNLLSNAVKFSDPGDRIALECDATHDTVTIRVIDSGHGIPPEKMGTIFDPFVQVNPNLSGDGGRGAGLGLAISHELARGMGGDLTVQSELGRGSVFTLTLHRSAA